MVERINAAIPLVDETREAIVAGTIVPTLNTVLEA
jgi:hypothetical protein